jgi:hypothetical protein
LTLGDDPTLLADIVVPLCQFCRGRNAVFLPERLLF